MQAIKDDGPIVMNFKVYSDFLNYTGGVYQRSKNATFLFQHVVLAIGYGPGYISALNSWGMGWGEAGHFHISVFDVESYLIPGKLLSRGGRYPYPLPVVPTTTFVFLEGFRYDVYNTDYREFASKKVNGKPTYWDQMEDYFIYYCEYNNVWALTYASNYKVLMNDGSYCYWNLMQRAEMCQGEITFSQRQCHWDQWDSKEGGMVACSQC